MVQRRYQPVRPRDQTMLLPPRLDDYVSKDNPVRALDAFVETLDLQEPHRLLDPAVRSLGNPFPPGIVRPALRPGQPFRHPPGRRRDCERTRL